MPKYDEFDLDLQNKSSISTNTAELASGASYPAVSCYCPSNCCQSDGCGQGTYPALTCHCK